jgi:3-(3-hydroxy-phenyl)propionate hydroxylase
MLDDLLQPRFLIASATREVQGWLTRESRALWRRLGGERIVIGSPQQRRPPDLLGDDEIQYLAETDPLFATWMRQLDGAAVVVRPDRYVFGVARDAAQLNRLIASVGRHVMAS